jgi:hypothetical protein
MKEYRDKQGDIIPEAAFDGTDGPLEGPNSVMLSLGPKFEKEFWANIDAEIAREDSAKKPFAERLEALNRKD